MAILAAFSIAPLCAMTEACSRFPLPFPVEILTFGKR
jgi:hypothetical protein